MDRIRKLDCCKYGMEAAYIEIGELEFFIEPDVICR